MEHPERSSLLLITGVVCEPSEAQQAAGHTNVPTGCTAAPIKRRAKGDDRDALPALPYRAGTKGPEAVVGPGQQGPGAAHPASVQHHPPCASAGR